MKTLIIYTPGGEIRRRIHDQEAVPYATAIDDAVCRYFRRDKDGPAFIVIGGDIGSDFRLAVRVDAILGWVVMPPEVSPAAAQVKLSQELVDLLKKETGSGEEWRDQS